MEKGAKAGLVGLAACLGAAGGFTALGAALYDRVMPPIPRDHASDSSDPPLRQEGRRWAREAEGLQEARILSVEGLHLWAAYLPAKEESHRWAVCVHGYHDDHTSMGIYGKRLHEAGFHVLLPDQRGYGRSEGLVTGWGYDERLDLVGWISWLLRRDPKAEILLLGVSMGAATVLMATGGALPKNVRAAVSDCSFSTLEAEMRHVMSSQPIFGERLSGVSSWVAFRALRQAALRRAGYDLCKVSPLDAVTRSRTPTLFIHGTADNFVPAQMMGRLYRAAACPKSFLWVPGSAHAVEAAEQPELYWGAVDALLEKYMPG